MMDDNFLNNFKDFSNEEFFEFFNSLTQSNAEEYGFRRWSRDYPLYLIPLKLADFIPIGITLTSIAGKKVVYDGNNIDDDTRGGLLAYGIILNE